MAERINYEISMYGVIHEVDYARYRVESTQRVYAVEIFVKL